MNYTPSFRPLGAIYRPDRTTFRVWTQAEKVNLLLFSDISKDICQKYPMKPHHDGAFDVTVEGDLAGVYYLFELDGMNRVADPWSFGIAPNGTHSAVIDLKRTDPEGFCDHQRPVCDYLDPVICETHIRDFTADPEAGYTYPGKFLSFAQSVEIDGTAVGVDYLKDFGVTHIHLMPVQDFASVDEIHGGYNWGYDPEFYFTFEGSYLVDLKDPHSRIREFKQMVMDLHAKGFGVIVDVVYNHTYHGMDSMLQKLAPGYYYRTDEYGHLTNGSGVGNELDTEKTMTGRLILESLLFMVNECKVDGFRFDLLGIIDISRTKEIVRSLRQADPGIVLYGEPWGGGDSALLSHKMTLKGSQRSEGFSLFNDIFRDALKGKNDDASKGYIQGNVLSRNSVLAGITGSVSFSSSIYGFTADPYESINYNSSHDNLILYDKLKLSTKSDDEFIKRLTKLLFGIQFLSFGVSFFHAGTDFMRTKFMHHNTYNLGDDINMIHWRELLRHRDLSDYLKALLALRRSIPAFRDYTAKDIREHLVFSYSNIEIVYTLELTEGDYEMLIVGHNPTDRDIDLPLQVKDARMLFYDGKITDEDYHGQAMKPFSSLVLAKKRGN